MTALPCTDHKTEALDSLLSAQIYNILLVNYKPAATRLILVERLFDAEFVSSLNLIFEKDLNYFHFCWSNQLNVAKNLDLS